MGGWMFNYMGVFSSIFEGMGGDEIGLWLLGEVLSPFIFITWVHQGHYVWVWRGTLFDTVVSDGNRGRHNSF